MTVFKRDIAPPAISAADKKSPWQKINPDTLPKGLRAAYDQWSAARKQERELKLAFTNAMRDCMDVPAGQEAFFSDRFGDLSFAFLDAKTAKAANSAVDFTRFMRK